MNIATNRVEQDHGEAIAELRSKIEEIDRRAIERLNNEVKTLNDWIGRIELNSKAILELQRQLSNLCEELVIIRLPKQQRKSRFVRWIFPED